MRDTGNTYPACPTGRRECLSRVKSVMKYLWIIMVLIFSGCGHKPVEPTPEPDIARQAAEQAFGEMENDATGAILDLESVAEPTADEITGYRTGEPGWVIVERTMPFNNDVPFSQAGQELLRYLRNEAVSKKVPATVEVTSLLTDMMSESDGMANEQSAWSGFFKSTVSGVITAEEILEDGFPKEIKNGYEKTMKLKAYVEPVSGQRDPGFYIDAHLENNMLKSGDELAFSITPSKDCYLYVFNLMADHNIMLMMPNEYFTENYIKGGITMEIPDPAIRKYQKFRVAPMPGEEITSESIYIVCTKEKVPIISELPMIGTSIKVFSANSQDFVKLQRWLTNIPLNERIEKNLIYHISR